MVLSLSLVAAAQGQKRYIVKGEIGQDNNGKMVRLNSYMPQLHDSAVVKNGKFRMEGKMKEPSEAYVSISTTNGGPAKIGDVVPTPDMQQFYLSDGVTTIRGANLESAAIDNPVQEEFLALKAMKKPLDERMNTLSAQIYYSKNKDSVKMLKAERRALTEQMAQTDLEFVKQHPGSYVSFNVVRSQYVVIEDPVRFEAMYNALAPSFRNTEDAAKMRDALAAAKLVVIGQPAIQFTQNDVNDKPLSLSSFKGKYVLVDFWASWCGPCRMEYPFLHQAYDKYKGKNFEILGVSLDSRKDVWIKSIADNKFDWPLVCDLKGFKNDVALAYGVHAIPQNFLVDPNGIIIAKNMRGEDLLDKLEEVLPKTTAAIQGGSCTVEVNVNQVEAKKVWLMYQVGEEHHADSARLLDGKASFHVNVPSPVSAMMSLDNRGFGYENGNRPDMLIVCLEPGTIHVETSDSIKHAVITGGPLNDELNLYRKAISGHMNQLENLNAQMMLASPEKRKDSAFCNGIWGQMREEVTRLREVQAEFAKSNPDNYGSLEALSGVGGSNIDPKVVGPLYDALSERLRNSPDGKELASKIETARKTGIGALAPDFTQNDVNDKPVKLSDFRGKYVLLDFWASWCGPCRAENPNYVKA